MRTAGLAEAPSEITGNPPKAPPKRHRKDNDRVISVRLTPLELEHSKRIVARSGLTTSEVARRALRHAVYESSKRILEADLAALKPAPLPSPPAMQTDAAASPETVSE